MELNEVEGEGKLFESIFFVVFIYSEASFQDNLLQQRR